MVVMVVLQVQALLVAAVVDLLVAGGLFNFIMAIYWALLLQALWMLLEVLVAPGGLVLRQQPGDMVADRVEVE